MGNKRTKACMGRRGACRSMRPGVHHEGNAVIVVQYEKILSFLNNISIKNNRSENFLSFIR